jgi:hypothetical protein
MQMNLPEFVETIPPSLCDPPILLHSEFSSGILETILQPYIESILMKSFDCKQKIEA